MSVSIPDPGPSDGLTASVEAIEGRLRSVLDLRSEAHVDERVILIEHRSSLVYMLCAAAELEHALMCELTSAAVRAEIEGQRHRRFEPIATALRAQAKALREKSV